MREYLLKLQEEKKILKKKLENINKIIDGSFGYRDYFAQKHYFYDKALEIRSKITIINNKIGFTINLHETIERKKLEEKIHKSNFNFKGSKTKSLGAR